MGETILDLRDAPASRVQSTAFYALKELRRSARVILLTAQEPSLMMQSLDLQLRHNLAWSVSAAECGWRVEVRHRADVAPRDVVDLLMGDHQRLDGLLARAMRLVDQDEVGAAAPLLREFAAALERHIGIEDETLAPRLSPAGEERDAGAAAIMRREHREIAGQLAVIGACLATEPPEAAEIGAFCSILSGTLAKHEYREENDLFPLWRGAWARQPQAQREEMMTRVQAVLGEGGSV
ncbi:MAG: hemerythrin domain-containing protein [Burkholderiales bacterium]